MTNVYAFEAKPQGLSHKPKYREPEGDEIATNMMFDKRIVRGSTFGKSNNKEFEEYNNSHNRKNIRINKSKINIFDIRPAPKDQHKMDLSPYLIKEESTKQVKSSSTITDIFRERPQTPVYIPQKTGLDVSTQIEESDNLFNFDNEVTPIVEVLVNKTLEQALMEVEEEEEMREMLRFKALYLQKEEEERIRIKNMEAYEMKMFQEKETLVAKESEKLDRKNQVVEKIDILNASTSMASSLTNIVIEKLQKKGYFIDPIAEEVREKFFPWLEDVVLDLVDLKHLANELLDSVLLNSINNARTKYVVAKQEQEKLKLEEEAKNAKKLVEKQEEVEEEN